MSTGIGSGGTYAHGNFIAGDRIIELHFRYSLLVYYRVGKIALTHEDYIDLLSKHGQNKYPNFSDDKQESFQCLLSDLKSLLTDFTENNASFVRQNGPAILNEIANKNLLYNRKMSGDLDLIDQAKTEFKKANYSLVNSLKKEIKYPDLLTATEIKMFELS